MRRLLLTFLPLPLLAVQFTPHPVATGLTRGYQVVAVDLNKDGKPDLLALASGMSELVWFENPGWQRHVIATGLHEMINVAARDLDGDGIPELALASEFSMDPAKSVGLVSLLTHQGDPTRPWSVREIDRLPTAHRLRWADVGGPLLINAPLAVATARQPDYAGHPPLVAYRPPDWKRQPVSEADEGVLHGILITGWEGGQGQAVLSTSFAGITLHRHQQDGWQSKLLTSGNPGPRHGSSDVAVGHLGRDRFLAAIEPWHGEQVVVYREQAGTWARSVIDTSLTDGHTILTADFDGDGRDEVVAGHRGSGGGVTLYRTTDGTRWDRQPIEHGDLTAASCTAADLNGDGRPDLACIGSATANLVWYENHPTPGH